MMLTAEASWLAVLGGPRRSRGSRGSLDGIGCSLHAGTWEDGCWERSERRLGLAEAQVRNPRLEYCSAWVVGPGSLAC